MSKTFRQADSRWGRFIYTRGGSSIAAAGCGPTALADIICNNPKYKDITPLDTAKWLKAHGYNIQGTTWDGIKACLEHYGFVVASPATMARYFELMSQGVYKWTIINFRNGSRGGITWTNGGHYVAASDNKVKNGKHYLYTRDPGSRHNDGWHCYETQMRGLVKKVWCRCRVVYPCIVTFSVLLVVRCSVTAYQFVAVLEHGLVCAYHECIRCIDGFR